jgi:hypothetical protein
MQLARSHKIPNRRPVPRLRARCAVAGLLFTAWGGIPSTVLAQSDPLPQMKAPGSMPAPIGHRQPRAQDLPPDVLRDEGMNQRPPESAPTMQPDASRDQGDRRAGRMPFGDGDLQICRQC